MEFSDSRLPVVYIVDAGIVPVPKQRNSREENKGIKQGEISEDWSEEKKRQKDTEVRWTKRMYNMAREDEGTSSRISDFSPTINRAKIT